MRKLLLLLLSLFTLLPAAAKDNVHVFARYECSRENVLAGDSTRVNIVLYSSQPFQNVKCLTKNIKIRGGEFRLLPRYGERQQQRVRLENGIYYAILWDSYMVGSTKVETIKFPELEFDCTVEVYEEEEYYDPFDPFGFFGRRQPKSHTVDGRCKAPSFALPVIERPKRSTQEAISSGSRIA